MRAAPDTAPWEEHGKGMHAFNKRPVRRSHDDCRASDALRPLGLVRAARRTHIDLHKHRVALARAQPARRGGGGGGARLSKLAARGGGGTAKGAPRWRRGRRSGSGESAKRWCGRESAKRWRGRESAKRWRGRHSGSGGQGVSERVCGSGHWLGVRPESTGPLSLSNFPPGRGAGRRAGGAACSRPLRRRRLALLGHSEAAQLARAQLGPVTADEPTEGRRRRRPHAALVVTASSAAATCDGMAAHEPASTGQPRMGHGRRARPWHTSARLTAGSRVLAATIAQAAARAAASARLR